MRCRALVASCLLLIAAEGARAQAVRDEVLRSMTPEQRENLWQSMTPQQRADFWRRLTPEQRQAIRQQITPQQRDAMHQRMMEERQRPMPPAAPPPEGTATHGMPPDPGPRRLSPEERQKLREQIMESTRHRRDERQPRMGGMHRGRGH